jgi:hypothetical protein
VLAKPRLVQPVDVGSGVEEAKPISSLEPDVPNLEGARIGELTDAFVRADPGVGPT